ncbi:CHAP domain-containing protein [Gardnerella vaginalis]|uniref:CHAP domain-containing protein n=1 Tax=Gardnerella vaginalis TaxID=2702 RepID=UPI00200C1C5E|nr:CHAP domain-containing protein [Gardnerella vaginalis]UQA83778.1 CHAP domain-containing protein [Gardnerella vaginalis]
MRHGAHGAKKAKGRFVSPFMLFSSSHISSATSERSTEAVCANNGAVVGLSESVAQSLQMSSAPRTRREIRLARESRERKNCIIVSTSLVAIVGAALTSMALSKTDGLGSFASKQYASEINFSNDSNDQAASRSSQREKLDRADKYLKFSSAVAGLEADLNAFSTRSSHESKWDLGSNSDFKVSEMSKSSANNPQVAILMDSDVNSLPAGFNPNHSSGDSGNAYEFSQCTWWVYIRRHQLGLPVGSNMGDGWMWALTARKLGYWVDHTPRHVGDIMVFGRGQAGVNRTYGHVAVVEKINPDGSIETSESSAELHGRTFSRVVNPNETSAFEFIHY